MTAESPQQEPLVQLAGLEDLREHSTRMAQLAQRQLRIFSAQLDPQIYEQAPFVDALSAFARRSRYTDIQLLIKDTRPLIERAHKLRQLAMRLPSHIAIRRLGIEPEDKDMSILLVDTNKILYRADESDYKGFANYAAGPEVRHYGEIFTRLWQQSAPDPELRQFSL